MFFFLFNHCRNRTLKTKKAVTMKEVGTKAIPASRRHIVNDPNELPDRYSSTPGGTLYSTTPGGE